MNNVCNNQDSLGDTLCLRAFAKINLTLDVLGKLDNGYHEVEMIMQQIELHDDVKVSWIPGGSASGVTIDLSMSREDLPVNDTNLAYRAAARMISGFGAAKRGLLRIEIDKHIPLAAGLAGGSSNCAAVIHAINRLWSLGLTLDELCRIGAAEGADVPFCILGQAAANKSLETHFHDDSLICHCALATGTGTQLKPLAGLDAYISLSKPDIGVSTAEVYRGIDEAPIPAHPDTQAMIRALAENNLTSVKKNMVNVLENFTLKSYPIVVYTKNKMSEMCTSGGVLMSGSGPTVFCLCESEEAAREICRNMKQYNRESFWTKSTSGAY